MNTNFKLLVTLCLFGLVCQCSKDDFSWNLKKVETRLASLQTINAFNVSTNSVAINSFINYDGGSAIINNGICWSTNQYPTLTDSFVNSINDSNFFTCKILNISPNTLYFVRAFAVNKIGIAYGNQISFRTPVRNQAKLVDSNKCNTLIGISSLYYGTSKNASWCISDNGYDGYCWYAPDYSQSSMKSDTSLKHYVQFDHFFSNEGYFEFLVHESAQVLSKPNITISVNGSNLNATFILEERTTLTDKWIKFRSPLIQKNGINTIRIYLSNIYYSTRIDELKFYEFF